jgi:hypothetical protein
MHKCVTDAVAGYLIASAHDRLWHFSGKTISFLSGAAEWPLFARNSNLVPRNIHSEYDRTSIGD